MPTVQDRPSPGRQEDREAPWEANETDGVQGDSQRRHGGGLKPPVSSWAEFNRAPASRELLEWCGAERRLCGRSAGVFQTAAFTDQLGFSFFPDYVFIKTSDYLKCLNPTTGWGSGEAQRRLQTDGRKRERRNTLICFQDAAIIILKGMVKR